MEGIDESQEEMIKCVDLHYINGFCYEYTLAADDACNVWAFSAAEIQWYSIDLKANYWTYREEGYEDIEGDADPFEDEFVNDFKTKLGQKKEITVEHLGDKKCVLQSDIPTKYEKSMRLALKGSECGHKF